MFLHILRAVRLAGLRRRAEGSRSHGSCPYQELPRCFSEDRTPAVTLCQQNNVLPAPGTLGQLFDDQKAQRARSGLCSALPTTRTRTSGHNPEHSRLPSTPRNHYLPRGVTELYHSPPNHLPLPGAPRMAASPQRPPPATRRRPGRGRGEGGGRCCKMAAQRRSLLQSVSGAFPPPRSPLPHSPRCVRGETRSSCPPGPSAPQGGSPKGRGMPVAAERCEPPARRAAPGAGWGRPCWARSSAS